MDGVLDCAKLSDTIVPSTLQHDARVYTENWYNTNQHFRYLTQPEAFKTKMLERPVSSLTTCTYSSFLYNAFLEGFTFIGRHNRRFFHCECALPLRNYPRILANCSRSVSSMSFPPSNPVRVFASAEEHPHASLSSLEVAVILLRCSHFFVTLIHHPIRTAAMSSALETISVHREH
jgi:hypothetical protein